MMFLKLVFQKLSFKWLGNLLCVLLMAIGVMIISLTGKMGAQLEKTFDGNISGIDMVVGAKGSPLQLILSSIFHIDAPTGNIDLAEAEKNLKGNKLVKSFIPLAYGDNFGGFRIVGSTNHLLAHYEAKPVLGRMPQKPMEAVLGNQVAHELRLNIGAKFTSAHGLDKEGTQHQEHQYTVVGILQPNGSVADRLIICDLQSIWQMHHHEEEHEAAKEITAVLVKFRSPMGLMSLPRYINENTNMQAAIPAIEINRLLTLFSSAILLSKYLAGLIIFVSGLSVFISLYNSLKDEKNEKALMISLGASRWQVFSLLLVEGLVLSFLGYLLGMSLSRLALFVAERMTTNRFHLKFDLRIIEIHEIYLFVVALCIGIISAAIPALGIYRLNLSKTLAKH